MKHLDLLAGDLLNAAAAILPAGDEGHILGLELAGRLSRVAYLVARTRRPALPVLISGDGRTRRRAGRGRDDGDGAAQRAPEATRIIVAYAQHTGAKIRVHARPATGEVVAATLHRGELIPIGRRMIARPGTLQ